MLRHQLICTDLAIILTQTVNMKPHLLSEADYITRDEDPVLAKNRIRDSVPQTKGDF